MMKIYHNPRCSKSRATLKILEDRGINLEVVEYLKNPPTKSELKKILDMLGKSAKEIIRTGEDAYKEATRGKDLTEDELNLIRTAVTKYTIEGDLRREVLTHIRRLKDIKSYRGSRHIKHLPARGQRTKTNNRTVRGNVRRTMGSGKAGAAQKT